jgi:hypothetical protein
MRHTLSKKSRRKRTLRKRTLRKRTLHKKRRTQKQSGGEWNIDKEKLNRVINNRSRAARFANLSAKKAQELQEYLDSL